MEKDLKKKYSGWNNNSSQKILDTGGIIFQYTQYDYGQQKMPIHYEAAYTKR